MAIGVPGAAVTGTGSAGTSGIAQCGSASGRSNKLSSAHTANDYLTIRPIVISTIFYVQHLLLPLSYSLIHTGAAILLRAIIAVLLLLSSSLHWLLIALTHDDSLCDPFALIALPLMLAIKAALARPVQQKEQSIRWETATFILASAVCVLGTSPAPLLVSLGNDLLLHV